MSSDLSSNNDFFRATTDKQLNTSELKLITERLTLHSTPENDRTEKNKTPIFLFYFNEPAA